MKTQLGLMNAKIAMASCRLHRSAGRYPNQRNRLHLSTLRLRHIQSGYLPWPRPSKSTAQTIHREWGRLNRPKKLKIIKLTEETMSTISELETKDDWDQAVGDQTCTKDQIEQVVIIVRLQLYNRHLPCGPKAVRQRLEAFCHVQTSAVGDNHCSYSVTQWINPKQNLIIRIKKVIGSFYLEASPQTPGV